MDAMKLIQAMINDEDLNGISMKQFRSILLHIQDFLGDEEEKEEDNDSDIKKYIL